ncbi:MAG: signal peptidase I [Clostridia bacterium]|nr:signal peptidase I [Clostridia bacterium]
MKKRRRGKFFRAWLACLVAALLIGWWLGENVFLIVTVKDGAMSPAIEAGSTIVCFRRTFLKTLVGVVPAESVQLRRGRAYLVAYHGADGEMKKASLMLRRALALPGDVVDVKDGLIIVNGEAEPSGAAGGDRVYPVTVPEGKLFLAGDNSALSVDSRRRSFGMPDIDDVIAHPAAVIWPLYAAGPVN